MFVYEEIWGSVAAGECGIFVYGMIDNAFNRRLLYYVTFAWLAWGDGWMDERWAGGRIEGFDSTSLRMSV